MNVPVYRGMTHDGLGKYLSTILTKAPGPTDDIVGILKSTHTDILINYLPVGSEMATKWYMEQALEAGVGVINCIPVFIASLYIGLNASASVVCPSSGDDIKSQVGATIVHRVLTSLFADRGVQLHHTYQLNFGGNTDFMNSARARALGIQKSLRPVR